MFLLLFLLSTAADNGKSFVQRKWELPWSNHQLYLNFQREYGHRIAKPHIVQPYQVTEKTSYSGYQPYPGIYHRGPMPGGVPFQILYPPRPLSVTYSPVGTFYTLGKNDLATQGDLITSELFSESGLTDLGHTKKELKGESDSDDSGSSKPSAECKCLPKPSTVPYSHVHSSTSTTSTMHHPPINSSNEQPATVHHPHINSSTEQPSTVHHPHINSSTEQPSSIHHPPINSSTEQPSTVHHPHLNSSTEQPSTMHHPPINSSTEQPSTVHHPHLNSSTEQPSTMQHPHINFSTEQPSTVHHLHLNFSTEHPSISRHPYLNSSTQQPSPVHNLHSSSSTQLPPTVHHLHFSSSTQQPSIVFPPHLNSSSSQPFTVHHSHIYSSTQQPSTVYYPSTQQPSDIHHPRPNSSSEQHIKTNPTQTYQSLIEHDFTVHTSTQKYSSVEPPTQHFSVPTISKQLSTLQPSTAGYVFKEYSLSIQKQIKHSPFIMRPLYESSASKLNRPASMNEGTKSETNSSITAKNDSFPVIISSSKHNSTYLSNCTKAQQKAKYPCTSNNCNYNKYPLNLFRPYLIGKNEKQTKNSQKNSIVHNSVHSLPADDYITFPSNENSYNSSLTKISHIKHHSKSEGFLSSTTNYESLINNHSKQHNDIYSGYKETPLISVSISQSNIRPNNHPHSGVLGSQEKLTYYQPYYNHRAPCIQNQINPLPLISVYIRCGNARAWNNLYRREFTASARNIFYSYMQQNYLENYPDIDVRIGKRSVEKQTREKEDTVFGEIMDVPDWLVRDSEWNRTSHSSKASQAEELPDISLSEYFLEAVETLDEASLVDILGALREDMMAKSPGNATVVGEVYEKLVTSLLGYKRAQTRWAERRRRGTKTLPAAAVLELLAEAEDISPEDALQQDYQEYSDQADDPDHQEDDPSFLELLSLASKHKTKPLI